MNRRNSHNVTEPNARSGAPLHSATSRRNQYNSSEFCFRVLVECRESSNESIPNCVFLRCTHRSSEITRKNTTQVLGRNVLSSCGGRLHETVPPSCAPSSRPLRTNQRQCWSPDPPRIRAHNTNEPLTARLSPSQEPHGVIIIQTERNSATAGHLLCMLFRGKSASFRLPCPGRSILHEQHSLIPCCGCLTFQSHTILQLE